MHHDDLGSVRALTDESGTTTDTRGYEAFGTKNVEAGTDPPAYGFAGEPFQADSMLAYHRARWMDSRVGRLEGMDHMGGDHRRPGTLHRYLYASNLPTGMVDPSGNDSEPNIAAMFATQSPHSATLAFPILGKVEVGGCDPAESPNCNDVLNAEILTAVQYLMLSPHGNRLLFEVLAGPKLVSLPNDIGDNRTLLGSPGTPPGISWDPHRAFVELHDDFEFGRRGRLSPAVRLAHEFLHHLRGLWNTPDDTPAGDKLLDEEGRIAQDLHELGFGESPRQSGAAGPNSIPYNDSAYQFPDPGPCRVPHSDSTNCSGVQ